MTTSVGGAPQRRTATPEEARALGNPLRLRIIREVFDAPLTNDELARRLGRDKATVLHHVRVLVAAGFLSPEPLRRGPRGGREIPYRSTGKSWLLSLESASGRSVVEQAMVTAFLEELEHARSLADPDISRLALRLTEAERVEFAERLEALLGEFAERGGGGGGDGRGAYAVFTAFYARPD